MNWPFKTLKCSFLPQLIIHSVGVDVVYHKDCVGPSGY